MPSKAGPILILLSLSCGLLFQQSITSFYAPPPHLPGNAAAGSDRLAEARRVMESRQLSTREVPKQEQHLQNQHPSVDWRIVLPALVGLAVAILPTQAAQAIFYGGLGYGYGYGYPFGFGFSPFFPVFLSPTSLLILLAFVVILSFFDRGRY